MTAVASCAALVGQLQVPVALDGQQAVALHAGHRLAHRGAALVQPLGDPGPQRDDALLLQLEDRPEVHLGGVDQVVHKHSSVVAAESTGVAAPASRTARPTRSRWQRRRVASGACAGGGPRGMAGRRREEGP